MNDQELFWNAFHDELEKTAVLGRFLPAMQKILAPARAAAGRLFAPAKQYATVLAAKHPRLAKFLGYAAGPVAAGAAMTVGELPFRRRPQIINVMPIPDEHMRTQFRGM